MKNHMFSVVTSRQCPWQLFYSVPSYLIVVSLTLFVFNTQDEISGISVYLSAGFKEIFLSLF